MKKILFVLLLPLIFSCNKDIDDNNGEELPSAINDGVWKHLIQLDSLGNTTEAWTNSSQCAKDLNYIIFISGTINNYSYNADSNTNDCILDTVYSYSYACVTEDYYQFAESTQENTFVYDVFISNDTMTMRINDALSDFNSGHTNYLIHEY